MLVLWQTYAVGTTDTTTRGMLLRRMARQRDTYGHLSHRGSAAATHRRLESWTGSCGPDRDPRSLSRRTAHMGKGKQFPSPIRRPQRQLMPLTCWASASGKRLRTHASGLAKGCFVQPTPAVHLWARWDAAQPHPKSCRCQHRSVQTHEDLPSPSVEWSMAFSLEKPPQFRACSSSLGGPQHP